MKKKPLKKIKKLKTQELFDEILDNLGNTNPYFNFIQDMYIFYKDSNYLSTRQFKSLRNVCSKFRRENIKFES